jgi:DNA-binding IclR family transcriptional regulator
MPNTEDARYKVGSVAKAIAVLELLASSPPEGTNLSDLARGIGASKSAVFSLVQTLVDASYVRASQPGPRYSLGLALVRLGDIAGGQNPLSEIGLPALARLNSSTGLTVRLAVSDDGYPVFVRRIDGLGSVRFHTPLGVREMPHASAAGKAIMSWLPEGEVRRIAQECGLERRTAQTIRDVATLLRELQLVRERGFAIDNEEDVDGVLCVAAPIFDHTQSPAGAVSATGLKAELPDNRIEAVVTHLNEAASSITHSLGGRRPQQSGSFVDPVISGGT